MKQEKSNNGCILALFLLLVCNIILNFIQGNCIDSLIHQIRGLEYIQSVIPYQIEETENTEGMEYEAE